MTSPHMLVGYDRVIGSLKREYPVRPECLPRVMDLVQVTSGDPEATLCYPVSPEMTAAVVALTGLDLADDCDWFLEPFPPQADCAPAN